MTRSYRELRRISDFRDRFKYLALHGEVGRETFGFDRYLNQQFYKSSEWRQARNDVIVRDNGCDLGVESRPIVGKILVHHINPLSPDDIIHSTDYLFDTDNLICCTIRTHNAIHFGDESLLPKPFVERQQGDTKLW